MNTGADTARPTQIRPTIAGDPRFASIDSIAHWLAAVDHVPPSVHRKLLVKDGNGRSISLPD